VRRLGLGVALVAVLFLVCQRLLTLSRWSLSRTDTEVSATANAAKQNNAALDRKKSLGETESAGVAVLAKENMIEERNRRRVQGQHAAICVWTSS